MILCALSVLPKRLAVFFHMLWECTPVTEFWKMVAFNLSKLFEIRLLCSPATLILNDLSRLGLTLDKRRALLAYVGNLHIHSLFELGS